MVTVGPHVFDSAHYEADIDILYLSQGEPVGHRIDDDGWHTDDPPGHSLAFDTSGDLVSLMVYSPRRLLERDGRIPIHDDDGTFIGVADVAGITAAINQPA